MPTSHVTADKMSVRGRQGGKHWTKAEVDARQAAAEGIKRQGAVILRAPRWLSPAARVVWKRVLRKTVGLELLDDLDSDMLAVYCDSVVKHREASLALSVESSDDAIKSVQAWARIVATYADKLGFTPAGRARLVKKKADEALDEFGEEFG